jgi:anti-anti-sigma factor
MILEQVELPGNILRVRLLGSLDIAGSQEIDAPLIAIAGNNNRVIVDLDAVTFLASIGIRLLVKAARSISNRGGRLVIYNPNFDAKKVLLSTGIDAIIPVVADETSALAECAK